MKRHTSFDGRYGGASVGFEELWAIAKSLWKSFKTGNWQAGEEARLMEQEAAAQLGLKYGILTTSGSCAGLLALSALELPRGSEVIIPAVTFPTIFNIIVQCGLVPVVVDCEVATYNLNLQRVEEVLRNRPNIRAIIAVHAVGNPVDMPRLMEIVKTAEKFKKRNTKKIYVIEDCCDSWGGGIEVKESTPSDILYKCEKPLSTTERNITDSQTPQEDKQGSIIGGMTRISHHNLSTGRFGWITSVKFLKDLLFTTRMKIHLIMSWITYNSYPSLSIVDNIAASQKLLDSQYETLRKHAKEQNFGIPLKRPETGKVNETSKDSSQRKHKVVKKLGSFGDISITSFHAAHIVSMGVGGGVFTDSPKLAERVRVYKDWGRQADTTKPNQYDTLPDDYNPRFIYEKIGYNFQILELQAAMGRVQLKKAKKIKAARQRNAEYLMENLAGLPDMFMPVSPAKSDVCWFSLPLTYAGDRGKLVAHLEKNGIETRSMFAGNILAHPSTKGIKVKKTNLAEANYILEHSFWITTHPRLTKKDLYYIISVFKDYFYV